METAGVGGRGARTTSQAALAQRSQDAQDAYVDLTFKWGSEPARLTAAVPNPGKERLGKLVLDDTSGYGPSSIYRQSTYMHTCTRS